MIQKITAPATLENGCLLYLTKGHLSSYRGEKFLELWEGRNSIVIYLPFAEFRKQELKSPARKEEQILVKSADPVFTHVVGGQAAKATP